MLRDCLIAELKARMPERTFIKNETVGSTFTFPAKHREVGDLIVYDDGDEATVELTGLSHTHFGCWEENMTIAEKEALIAKAVVDFLEQIFADKVIISMWFGGLTRSWRVLQPNEVFPGKSLFRTCFTWSGPVRLRR